MLLHYLVIYFILTVDSQGTSQLRSLIKICISSSCVLYLFAVRLSSTLKSCYTWKKNSVAISFFCHPVFMAVYGYWLEWQPATMWGCQLTLYSFCKIVTVTSRLGCRHCLHSNVDCGAGLCNGRASVLSVPLIDSSSGGWRVCSCAPSGQEISIVSCRCRI